MKKEVSPVVAGIIIVLVAGAIFGAYSLLQKQEGGSRPPQEMNGKGGKMLPSATGGPPGSATKKAAAGPE